MAVGQVGINEEQPPESGVPSVVEVGGRVTPCCMIILKIFVLITSFEGQKLLQSCTLKLTKGDTT